MPLKKGKSRKTVSHNIKEMVHGWEDSGKIGASHPRSKKKAVKQAVAIALDKSREPKPSRSTKKRAHRKPPALRLVRS